MGNMQYFFELRFLIPIRKIQRSELKTSEFLCAGPTHQYIFPLGKPSVLVFDREKGRPPHGPQLILAWDSGVIKVQEVVGWGCQCGENCWLQLELQAKGTDFQAGPKNTKQWGEDESSESAESTQLSTRKETTITSHDQHGLYSVQKVRLTNTKTLKKQKWINK